MGLKRISSVLSLFRDKKEEINMIKFENIPPYLKANDKWCKWRYENRDSGITKISYNPMTNAHASVKILFSFTNFDSVINALNSYDGIEIRVDGKLAAVDLDYCIDNEKLSPFAEEIISHFENTYTEISPCGTGLCKILFVADGYVYDKDTYHIKKSETEVYVAGATNHFITITGGDVYLKNEIAENIDGLQ